MGSQQQPAPYSPPGSPTTEEERVIVAFHSFMQGALAQAHAECLLSTQVLASAEADIQVVGPAISLYLAALRSEGDPPSITTPHIRLSRATCPPTFLNWFQLWQDSVPGVQALPPEYQHDLARVICEQEPETQPFRLDLPRLAQNFRALAIEISQRRTFQERFNDDLQYAIESGMWGRRANPSQRLPSARYQPPPGYDDGTVGSRPPEKRPPGNHPPATGLPSPPPLFDTAPLNLRRPAAPPGEVHPTLSLIRETLYAALADVLYSTPTILSTLARPTATGGELSRAYFAAVCLAILHVSLREVDPQTGRVHVVTLGRDSPTTLGLDDCPPHLRPLMVQLGHIAVAARVMAEGDDTRAMRLATSGFSARQDRSEDGGVPRMERLRAELEKGANWEAEAGRATGAGAAERPESPLGEVRALANRINGLALRFSQIEAFKEREEQLFEVLVPQLAQTRERRRHRA